MEKGVRVLRIVTGVLTLAVCLLFIWQAADIYITGNRPENFSAPGVRVEDVYSREVVAERFARVAPAVYGYLAVVLAGLDWQAAAKEKERPRAVAPAQTRPVPEKRLRTLRLTLLAIAAALIVWGAVNGGARDVLVKAVNICTECIGLG